MQHKKEVISIGMRFAQEQPNKFSLYIINSNPNCIDFAQFSDSFCYLKESFYSLNLFHCTKSYPVNGGKVIAKVVRAWLMGYNGSVPFSSYLSKLERKGC